MASLRDLENLFENMAPKNTVPSVPTGAPTVSKQVPGDELMAKAQAVTEPAEEDVQAAKLIQDSYRILQSRIGEDEKYAASVLPSLQVLSKADRGMFFRRVIDEADAMKIDYIKKTEPDAFTSEKAALHGFANTALFGQLSRIIGKVGETVDGRPYEQVVAEVAERARLMQKAFPKSDFVGSMAAYLIPGSPAKALFTRLARAGGKAVAGSVAKVLSNEKMLYKVVKRLQKMNPSMSTETAFDIAKATREGLGATITNAASGAAGAGGSGFVQGVLGSDLQDFSLDRGVVHGGLAAGGGGLMGAFMSAAATARQARSLIPATTTKPRSTGLRRGYRQDVENLVENFSGTPARALREYKKNPQGIQAAAGTEGNIGRQFEEYLTSQKSGLLEVAHAKEFLPQMGRIDATPIVRMLRSGKRRAGINPKNQRIAARDLEEWALNIEKRMDKNGTISANQMWSFKQQFQEAAEYAASKGEVKFLESMMARAGFRARVALEKAAKGLQNESGDTYVGLMRRAADKRRIMSFLYRKIGRAPEQWEQRSKGFFTNLFGKNNEVWLRKMVEFDQKFGTNFVELARNAHFAKQLGPGGRPLPVTSKWNTGAFAKGVSTLGVGGATIGLIAGHAPLSLGIAGAALGTAASSPRAGMALLGASDKISGFVRVMLAKPEVLARLAGRVQKQAAKAPLSLSRGGVSVAEKRAADIANKKLATMRLPFEIRRIAREIHDTYTKHGPASAASTVRLIADTPYFLGLVHAFDLADTYMHGRAVTRGASLLGRDGEGLAIKPQ